MLRSKCVRTRTSAPIGAMGVIEGPSTSCGNDAPVREGQRAMNNGVADASFLVLTTDAAKRTEVVPTVPVEDVVELGTFTGPLASSTESFVDKSPELINDVHRTVVDSVVILAERPGDAKPIVAEKLYPQLAPAAG